MTCAIFKLKNLKRIVFGTCSIVLLCVREVPKYMWWSTLDEKYDDTTALFATKQIPFPLDLFHPKAGLRPHEITIQIKRHEKTFTEIEINLIFSFLFSSTEKG